MAVLYSQCCTESQLHRRHVYSLLIFIPCNCTVILINTFTHLSESVSSFQDPCARSILQDSLSISQSGLYTGNSTGFRLTPTPGNLCCLLIYGMSELSECYYISTCMYTLLWEKETSWSPQRGLSVSLTTVYNSCRGEYTFTLTSVPQYRVVHRRLVRCSHKPWLNSTHSANGARSCF